MTIQEMAKKNREAGFHWFEPQTMRFFKCRILPEVYSGPGGLFFISSEQHDNDPRTYTVRKFNPETGNVDGVEPKLSMTRPGNAKRLARKLAAAGGTTQGDESAVKVETGEKFKPLTDAQQFAFDIRKEFSWITEGQIRRLLALARRHEKLAEMECGDGTPMQEQHCAWAQKQTPKVEKQIMALCAELGCEADFSGDPRGYTVKLKLPSGRTNDFGREGFGIPTK